MAGKVVMCGECYERNAAPYDVRLCPLHAQAEQWKALAQEAMVVFTKGNTGRVADWLAKARELGLEIH